MSKNYLYFLVGLFLFFSPLLQKGPGAGAVAQCNSCLVHINAGPVNPLCDSTQLDWAAWTSVTPTSGSGTISSGLNLTVTKPTGGMSTTPVIFSGGLFPPQYNVPVNTTAIRNDLAGIFTFCYNQPVRNPQIALASIGNPGLSVQVNTSECYDVVWPGQGMSYPTNTSFIGTEGYTIIRFPGTHTCISFDYLQSESYCNLAFGVLDTNCQIVPTVVCQGNPVTLTASGGSTYTWSPTAGLSSGTGAMVVATPSVTTKYFVTDGNCSDSVVITVNPLPVISITGDTNLCAGESTVLTASGGGNYLWNTGETTSAISVTPALSGNFNVVVTDPNGNGCMDSLKQFVLVNALPVANAGTNVSVCSGSPLTLNASGGGTYSWTPATGLSSTTAANPVFTGTTTTTYTVTVTDLNSCTSSDDITVTVFLTPEVSFIASAVCFTNMNQFTGNATGPVSQWSWNFGEPASGVNNVSALQNPSHTYGTSGTFIVTLIVISPDGCSDTITGPAIVHPLPLASFSSTTVCIGSPTVFTDQSTVNPGSITSWSWNFGDPASGAANTSNIQNPTHVFTAVGLFNVLLTVTTNNGCQSATTPKVLVLFPPIASYSFASACVNASTFFQDLSTNATNWAWTFGDGGTSNTQSPAHTYTASGNYIVTLIASSTGSCADTVTDTVAVYPLPVVQALSDTVCLGDSSSFFNFSFVPVGTITAWHWDFGDGDTSNVKDPKHKYPNAGTYTATITATSSNGCVDSATVTALIYPLPTADFNFSPAPTAQLIDLVSFDDLSSGGPVSWWWEFGDGDTSAFQYPSHFYSDTGNFVVTLVVASANGCVDTVQKTVEVRDFAFYMPNTFSPNGDDLNELFFGKGVGILEYELNIFDRWGNMIFYCKVKDLPQTLPCMWDGKAEVGASNKIAQQDVYVWKVKLTSTYYKQYDYIGNVNIVR